jgi:hypothetical protein
MGFEFRKTRRHIAWIKKPENKEGKMSLRF